MSSGAKQEILWSPVHKDKFISWGTDLGLYEVAPLTEIEKKPACIKLSESTGAHLVASNGNHHYVKCVDIYPKEDPDLLLALGQANGKIVLTTFGPTNFDTLGINGKELVPRYARTCNSVAWNRTEPSIIGAALDKYRNDHCILLWDIMKCSGGSTSPRTSSNGFMYNAATAVELARPIAEMGLSETAHSLAWPQGQSRTLVVGMNQKQIKMFDLRDFSNKAVTVTSSKYVYDVCVDPFKDYQLASRADATICVWDARSFDKPLLTLHQAKPVTKILWCPTRQNLLGSLQIDSCSLRLHDVQHTPTQPLVCNTPTCELPTNMTPTALERNVSPGSPHIITSFSWHPTHQCRLLTIALSGSITDYTVSERITLNWGPGSGQIVWSHGHKTLHMLPESFYASLDDISFKMKRRASTDYGLRPDLAQNGDLADDENLKHLWQWLYLSKSLVEEGCIRGTSTKHPGVKTVLKLEGNATPSSNGSSQTSYRSETVMSAFMSQSADFGTLHNLTYRSEERSRALQLCGWSWEAEGSSLVASLERVETEGCPARAAALAAFHLRLRPAIDILNRAHQKSSSQSASGSLGVVALALAGYSEERGGLWRALCSAVRPTLHDPYLQALFAFLVADNGCYDVVLNECDMSVEDRVAFACMFLSDTKLADFIRHLTNKVVEEGNLSGFLLTGTSSEGLQLLQNYVERTGDVQSATLLAARALPHDLLSDSRVQHWITSYRTLLDSWRLWWRRGLLDIALCAGAPPAPGVPLSTPAVAPAPLGVSKPHQQVYISCNYCGKTISAYPQGLTRTRSTFARIAASSNKLKQISACPNCRKPLPRCAVCLLHMGTGSGTGAREPHKTVTFPSWFTWCQACRHGGHADHIMQWFKEHTECPVTSCTCRCLSADITSQNI